tara:strand:+ start:682 stop:801 length:120 start_codon:yes stop_codon:yes gene_type:complete
MLEKQTVGYLKEDLISGDLKEDLISGDLKEDLKEDQKEL